MKPLLLLFSLFASTVAQGGMKAPSKALTQPVPIAQPSATSFTPAQNLGLGGIRLFQLLLSPLDGPRSPSYPTGSAYGWQAVRAQGFFLGSLLTADRLFHEADHPLGPMIRLYGQDRYFDPLRANLYWWSGVAP